MFPGLSPVDAVAPRSAFALASEAAARAAARLHHAADDLFLPEEARLSDRTRAAVHVVIEGMVAAAAAELRRHAARLLAARGADVGLGDAPVLDRLRRAGLLRDPDLLDELIPRVELDLLADALPPGASRPDGPGLLTRLADDPDGVVASAARALLRVENRRRAALEGAAPIRSELPAELHQRLLWWIAAALRDRSPGPGGMADRDRALAEATLRSLAAHDEADRPEVAAERLAAALDLRPDELGSLLTDALADRRLTLFTALAARAGELDYEQARRLVVDPDPSLLLLLVHALGLDRPTLARIGVALAEGDARRDLEKLADAVDWAAAHGRDRARAALAPLALGRDFRAAVRALGRNEP